MDHNLKLSFKFSSDKLLFKIKINSIIFIGNTFRKIFLLKRDPLLGLPFVRMGVRWESD